ncbi:MAG: class I SAM-dependent methyltransferase [Epsilonproteobacteria bacterium]|nr:class I SAM-dependent methyltransferase [Campylobacterota bacterium]
MINPLDLYAKIESLIGFDAQYELLYQNYLEILNSLHVKRVLDVGCGNGKFLKHLKENSFEAFGIDRSAKMVERALALGVNASTKELNEWETQSFECVVAIADVLNYISPLEINAFLDSVAEVLPKGGYFLCDINTLYGFEGVAEGVMCQDNGHEFLCVDATFTNKELLTKIVLFEKEGSLYRKEEGSITQYFHPLSLFKKLTHFKLLSTKPITLFGEEPDKTLLMFQKR